MTGKPFMLVRAVITCPRAESSATMYRKRVTSVIKLKYSAAGGPYRWRVHSVRTNPSGHFRLMMGPTAAKAKRGRADDRAYTTTPWTPARVASSG